MCQYYSTLGTGVHPRGFKLFPSGLKEFFDNQSVKYFQSLLVVQYSMAVTFEVLSSVPVQYCYSRILIVTTVNLYMSYCSNVYQQVQMQVSLLLQYYVVLYFFVLHSSTQVINSRVYVQTQLFNHPTVGQESLRQNILEPNCRAPASPSVSSIFNPAGPIFEPPASAQRTSTPDPGPSSLGNMEHLNFFWT